MLDLNPQNKNKRKNQKGMAFVESIPVLFMVVVVFNFSLGFFGAIHSGILNSIAAYNYTMETFRFRSNLMYFRPGDRSNKHYANAMNRVHGVAADGIDKDDTAKRVWPSTVRSIAMARNAAKLGEGTKDGRVYNKASENNRDGQNVWGVRADYSPNSKDSTKETPEIWIKTVYGICLNAECRKE